MRARTRPTRSHIYASERGAWRLERVHALPGLNLSECLSARFARYHRELTVLAPYLSATISSGRLESAKRQRPARAVSLPGNTGIQPADKTGKRGERESLSADNRESEFNDPRASLLHTPLLRSPLRGVPLWNLGLCFPLGDCVSSVSYLGDSVSFFFFLISFANLSILYVQDIYIFLNRCKKIESRIMISLGDFDTIILASLVCRR